MFRTRHTNSGSIVTDTYWDGSVEQLMKALRTTTDGLSDEEAIRRRESYGANTLRPPARFTRLRLLTRQLKSPLVAILAFAAVVSAFAQDWTDSVIIVAILIGSTVLGFVQEYRSSVAMDRLRARVRIVTRVVRNGRTVEIPPADLVPGDVVLLSAGDLIPADGRVVESRDLLVGQAALTGEPFPVEKSVGTVPATATLSERSNCLFMGTSVRSGTGRMLVVHTGEHTLFGGISARLRLRPPETEFERGIRLYGYLLMRITIGIVILVFAAQFLLERPPLEALLFALALAVAISPELLPAIIEVTLAKGAQEMASHGVIVRRLSAIQNLGSMDVLCTDKTATLTRGVMDLEVAADCNGERSDRVLSLAYLNARLQAGLDSPLDEAIIDATERNGPTPLHLQKLDEIPYDFVRRRLTVVVAENNQGVLITKGAFANVVDLCSHVRDGTGTAALDDRRKAALEALFAAWSSEGGRVLGLATRILPLQDSYARTDEVDMTFEGFLVFRDPPKPGIRETLETLRSRGVTIKIVTGDNPLVTVHLAREIGFEQVRILTGRDLDHHQDNALRQIATEVDLFAEVDPNQKERVLLALKKSGHVVGYMGDGINDASALHSADVGISVDQAVDVAKEAADFVLLEPDLDVLRRGIESGRASFANTLKYISITTSANFGNMLSMAVASFFLPFLPLLAKQILLNNLLSDIPMIGLPGDRVDEDRIQRPRRWEIKPIRNFMLVYGLASSVFDLITFGTLYLISRGNVEIFRTGWFLESLLTELAIIFVMRTQLPIHRSRPGRLLMASSILVFIVSLSLPWLPVVNQWFEFEPLSVFAVSMVIGITLMYVATSETMKRRFAIP